MSQTHVSIVIQMAQFYMQPGRRGHRTCEFVALFIFFLIDVHAGNKATSCSLQNRIKVMLPFPLVHAINTTTLGSYAHMHSNTVCNCAPQERCCAGSLDYFRPAVVSFASSAPAAPTGPTRKSIRIRISRFNFFFQLF